MPELHSALVFIHIAIGSFALVLFWAPVVARKGGALHVRSGKLYVVSMYLVSVTAFAASVLVLADPLTVRAPDAIDTDNAERLAARYRMFSLFLLMLSILVFASLRHGILALRARVDKEVLRTPLHRVFLLALALTAGAVGYLGVVERQVLLIVFAVIGLSGALGMLRDSFRENPSRGDLVFMHLNGLIGSGIGAYTAFFAFGGSRLLADVLVGQWQTLAWITPAVIGTIAIRRQRRRFSARRVVAPNN